MPVYNQHLGDAYMDSFNRPSRQHSLQRTSPKGEPFVGTCSLCGKAGMTFDDMQSECENQRGLTQEDAVIEAIHPPGTEGSDPDCPPEGYRDPNR